MANPTNLQNTKILFRALARERANFLAGKRPDKTNWFKMIDGPPNLGVYSTGDDGWDALWALTDAAMASGGIAARADRGAARKILACILMRKFISEELEIDQRNVDRALSETAKTAKRDFTSLTHFVPCHLSTDSDDLGIALGSIRFLSRREAKKALSDALHAERKAAPRSKGDRAHIYTAIDHYRGYRWFVQAPVEQCAPKRSEAIAMLAATSALDFLQLIIGTRNSQKMRISGQSRHSERTATITRHDPSGRFNISTGWNILGENLPKGWTSKVSEDEGRFACEQAGVILETRLNPDLDRPLSLRMLDVAQWYGEAARDRSASTRLVKFVTALERLTLTRKEKTEDEPARIAEMVSDRVTALTAGLVNEASFDENKRAFKRIYNVRSELVHGSISPLHPKVAGAIRDANDYCENAINRALHNWHRSAFIDPKFNAQALEEWFDKLVDWRKRGAI